GCLIISPIAPHNLTMRPVVVPSSSTIEMHIHMREGDAYLCLDNRSYNINGSSRVKITKAKESLYLAQREGSSFYQTLREKMMWGVDIR
ncbi:MAG: NADH kinase, partial [Rikenellaceae bacterium]